MPVLILEPQQEVASETSEQPKREGEGRHMSGSLRLFIHLGGHLPRDRPCYNVSSLLQGLPVCPETLPYTSALDQLCETRGKDPASGAPFAHSRPLRICALRIQGTCPCASPLQSFIPMAYSTAPCGCCNVSLRSMPSSTSITLLIPQDVASVGIRVSSRTPTISQIALWQQLRLHLTPSSPMSSQSARPSLI